MRSPVRNRRLQFALGFILGGALGNLYDRISYGYVIDFIEVYFRNYHWPSFNVADSAISTGVVLLAFEIIRNEADSRDLKNRAYGWTTSWQSAWKMSPAPTFNT